jgi:hypothetical protein
MNTSIKYNTLIYSFLSLIFLASTPGIAAAQNACYCTPTSKKEYIGEARQQLFIGYKIHWLCEYKCTVHPPGSEPTEETIMAEYQEIYHHREMGLEGICEGMVYEPTYNMDLGREIYVWQGKVDDIDPKGSSSKTLKTWANANDCR